METSTPNLGKWINVANQPDALMQQQQIAMAQMAMRLQIPKLYANGFATAQSASDMSVILMANGTPSGVISMSYITAKSLIVELTQAVSDFEKALGQQVMTITEITPLLQKVKGTASAL